MLKDKICIIDYDSGNIKSVKNIIEHLGYNCDIVRFSQEIQDYKVIFLPGVGSFDDAILKLKEHGIYNELQSLNEDQYLIGICLGMQLMLEKSEEGTEEGLGLIKGKVKKFCSLNNKVPHMGWNSVAFSDEFSQRFDLNDSNKFYFVHSYYACPDLQKNVYGITNYNGEFVSAIGDKNIFGFQFHPEKSHKFGIKLLSSLLGDILN